MFKRTAHNKIKHRQRQARQAQIKGITGSIAEGITNFRNKLLHRESSSEKKPHPDWVLVNIIVGLSIFGWLMIYSGSFYVASQRTDTLLFSNNPYHFFILQGLWLLVAAVLGYVAYKLPLALMRKLSVLGLMIVGVLLILVLLAPTINGAKQWILIGPFSLQPSEFAKPMLIVYLASLLSQLSKKKFKEFKDYSQESLLPFAVVALPVVALILLGRDLATAGLVGMIAISIYFFSQNSGIHNAVTLGLVGLALIGGVVFTNIEGYRQNRVETYTEFLATGEVSDPLNTGYQLRQILIAVGSGGWSGYGFGQSRQKYFYLQETAFSDTIFAVIAEEFGFVGSVLVILAYLVLIFRAIKISQLSKDKFQQLVAIGIALWIFLQAAIHLGVNVGLIPLTGMTMPLLSYGGSSLLATMIGLGILLNISKQVRID